MDKEQEDMGALTGFRPTDEAVPSSPEALIPSAGDVRWTEGGIEAFSHHVSQALAPILRERLWRGDRGVIDRLTDMAALSHAAIGAMHSWVAQAIEARQGGNEVPSPDESAAREGAPSTDGEPSDD